MALANVNGADVLVGRIYLPRVGVWHADLALDTEDTSNLTGAVTLDIGGGQLTLVGTAYRVGAAFHTVTIRMLGGAGGLSTVIPPKYYQGVPLSLPLQDILTAAGETLSPTTDPVALQTLLMQWTRLQGKASDCLDALIESASNSDEIGWRVLPDGTVFVGPETWPPVTIDYDLLSDDENLACAELGVETPTLIPGTLLAGRQVSFVEHAIEPKRTRTIVWFE
jgi:hypothetical protein